MARNSAKFKVLCALVAAAIAIGLWWHFASPNVDRSAGRFADAFERKDWCALYDMASEKEKQMQTFGRSQFVALMTLIADRRFGKVKGLTFASDWQRQTTSKFFTFQVETEKRERIPVYLHFYRDADDWHPEIARIPLLLYSTGARPSRDDAVFLHDACRKAGVSSIVRLLDRLEFSNDRLGQYLGGKSSWSAVSRPLPPP